MASTSAPRVSLPQRLLFSLITTVIVLGAVEVAARALLPPPRPSVGQFAEVDPFVPDPEDPGMFVTQAGLADASGGWDILREQRFSARKSPGTYRVLMVGGSSVYQLHENIPEIQAGLAGALGVTPGRIEVINGGGNGQGSAGVRHVVEFMLDKDVDAVVVYTAHNEYTQHLVRWGGGDTWIARLQGASATVRGLQMAVDAARLARVRQASAPRAAGAEATGATAAPKPVAHVSPVLEELGEGGRQTSPPDEVARRYEANLRAMVAETRAHGVAMVMTTVPSNLLAPSWYGTPPEAIARFEALRASGDLAAAAALADEELSRTTHLQSTHVENDILRRVAREESMPLADVEAALVGAAPHHVQGEVMFADHCHLNGEGRHLWVATVVPVLAQALAR